MSAQSDTDNVKTFPGANEALDIDIDLSSTKRTLVVMALMVVALAALPVLAAVLLGFVMPLVAIALVAKIAVDVGATRERVDQNFWQRLWAAERE